MSLPTTMKSLNQPSIHSPSLTLTTVPLPTPEFQDDHLIRVHAFAPTLGELTWAAYFPEEAGQREFVPGTDMAGVVVTAPASSPFQVGDRVFALMDFKRAGAGREFCLVRKGLLAKIPENVGFVEAAAVPMGGLTAWQNLFIKGGLKSSGIKDVSVKKENAMKKVMVIGAGGGVGSIAVQLAKLCGAEVTGVCSSSKEALVRGLGASEIVDYTKTSISEYVKNTKKEMDLVFDCVGRESLVQAWEAAREGGILLSIVQPPDSVRPEGMKDKKMERSEFFVVKRDGGMLAEVGELVGEGKVKATVDSVFGFGGEWQMGFDRAMEGKSAGRVVIKVVE